ncbi:MAG: hypothetical protein B7Z66_12270 [Chromatiales bacterium 21-64-14]|nr:MAG: hypothetical protein B7Z66_12270 [Chromatiales bacterium 21-64-14]
MGELVTFEESGERRRRLRGRMGHEGGIARREFLTLKLKVALGGGSAQMNPPPEMVYDVLGDGVLEDDARVRPDLAYGALDGAPGK